MAGSRAVERLPSQRTGPRYSDSTLNIHDLSDNYPAIDHSTIELETALYLIASTVRPKGSDAVGEP
jgi:hypothetical protein